MSRSLLDIGSVPNNYFLPKTQHHLTPTRKQVCSHPIAVQETCVKELRGYDSDMPKVNSPRFSDKIADCSKYPSQHHLDGLTIGGSFVLEERSEQDTSNSQALSCEHRSQMIGQFGRAYSDGSKCTDTGITVPGPNTLDHSSAPSTAVVGHADFERKNDPIGFDVELSDLPVHQNNYSQRSTVSSDNSFS